METKNLNQLADRLQQRTSKFHRRGIFKPLESFSNIKRTMFATYQTVDYYLGKQKLRFSFGTIGYLFAVNYLFTTFNKTLQKHNIDPADPKFQWAMALRSDQNNHNLISDVLLMQGISQILYNEVSKQDKTGLIRSFATVYQLMSKHAELSLYWRQLVPAILSRELQTRGSEILINCKTKTYYKPANKSKTISNPLLHGFYFIADTRYNGFKPEQIHKGKPYLITKLLIGYSDLGSDGLADTLIEKYLACYQQIEDKLKEFIKSKGLAIDEADIQQWSEIFYILYVNSLHSIVEKDIENFETHNTTFATMADPAIYNFKLKYTQLMFQQIENSYRLFNMLQLYTETFSKLEQPQNYYELANICRKNIAHSFKNLAQTSKKSAVRKRTLLNMQSIFLTLIVDYEHDSHKLMVPSYVNKLRTDLESYTIVEEYTNSIKYHFMMLSGLKYIVTSSFLVLPAYIAYVREDLSKYLFLYTSHEVWIGTCILLLFIINVGLNIAIYAISSVAYCPSIPFLSYTHPRADIIRIYQQIMLKHIYSVLINNLKTTTFHVAFSMTIQYLLDTIGFMRSMFYIQNIYYVYDVSNQFANKYILNRGLCNNLPIADTLKATYNIVADSYINLSDNIQTGYVLVSNSDGSGLMSKGPKYMPITSLYPTLNSTAYLFYQYIPPISLLVVLFVYYRIKTWNWYGTPEEFVSL